MNRLDVENISIRFGGLVALQNVSLSVGEAEIVALIGPNGAGKTTLFNIMSGVYRPTEGRILLGGEDVTGQPPFRLARRGLTRTFQNLQIFPRMSVVENVMVGRNLHEAGSLLGHILGLPSVRRQNRDSEARAMDLLSFIGLQDQARRTAGELPYGMLKRLEIARALATEPKVLLLDEPVAGCNATETAEVDNAIRKIVGKGVSVVLVEHDIHLVMNIADKVHVLDRGVTLAQGKPAEVRSDPAVIKAYLGAPEPQGASHAAR